LFVYACLFYFYFYLGSVSEAFEKSLCSFLEKEGDKHFETKKKMKKFKKTIYLKYQRSLVEPGEAVCWFFFFFLFVLFI
jgi:hypothetical protein